jgi:murein DD-endopeptidase MepM/ murein hydrolase activator NlpD
MASDPSLSRIISKILKQHINDLSKSNKTFRQAASSHASEFKNIVGQIHKAIDFNNQNFKRSNSSLEATQQTTKQTTETINDIASTVRNSTNTINAMIKQMNSLTNFTAGNMNRNNTVFSRITDNIRDLTKKGLGILGTVGTIASLGVLRGGAAKVAGAAVVGGAAAYLGTKQKQSIDQARASQAEAANDLPQTGPSRRERETTESDSSGARSSSPSSQSAKPAPQQAPGTPEPSDAKPSTSPGGTPNVIGGYTSTDQIPQHGGSKFSREFGFYKDTPQGRVPIRGGRGHAGLDIPIKTGQPYKAHMDGTVIKKGFDKSGYGHYVDVKFADGTIHRFSHMGSNDGKVKPFGDGIDVGKQFKKGDTLGFGGYSGNAGPEFPHVHHELWRSRGNPGDKNYQSADDLYEKSIKAGGSRAGMQYRSDPRPYWMQEEEKEKKRLEEEKKKQDATQKPQTEAQPDASRPTGTDDRIPNPNTIPPGYTTKGEPMSRVLAHISGFQPGSSINPDTGKLVTSTSEELDLMKKGRYAKPGVSTGYGYHSAVASSYVDEKTGKILDETEYNKLSAEEKKKYTERAEIHGIRPYNARPFQAGPLNMSSYGFATVGKMTPAKVEAMKNHLAKLYSEGVITKEALENIFGHGELQKHGNRGIMQPGGEGAPMAGALRDSIDEILKRGEEMKKKQQPLPQVPMPPQAPTQAPIKTDIVPENRTDIPTTINQAAIEKASTIPTQTQQTRSMNTQQPNMAQETTSQNDRHINPLNSWTPNLRSAESYVTQKQQQSVAV